MRLTGFESRTKAAFEMVVIHGLAEITDDPILQGAVADDLIRVRGDENRRDPMSRIDQMSWSSTPVIPGI